MESKRIAALVALALPLAIMGAALRGPSDSVSSSCAVVQGAEVCTWVAMRGEEALELGATIPMELIESVPTDAEMVWPPEQMGTVALPDEARRALGIDHLGINWEAHGHPPASFLTPHFDFHFYNVTEGEVARIDCTDLSKPSRLPAGYALPDIDVPGMGLFVGLCVPRMGMHAMVEGEVEETAAFDASMMLGYYGGAPIFFEPMISRDRLLERSDFALSVPVVAGLPAGVRYPTKFRAEYDDTEKQYRLILSGFVS
jgi:hypothetical protein